MRVVILSDHTKQQVCVQKSTNWDKAKKNNFKVKTLLWFDGVNINEPMMKTYLVVSVVWKADEPRNSNWTNQMESFILVNVHQWCWPARMFVMTHDSTTQHPCKWTHHETRFQSCVFTQNSTVNLESRLHTKGKGYLLFPRLYSHSFGITWDVLSFSSAPGSLCVPAARQLPSVCHQPVCLVSFF